MYQKSEPNRNYNQFLQDNIGQDQTNYNEDLDSPSEIDYAVNTNYLQNLGEQMMNQKKANGTQNSNLQSFYNFDNRDGDSVRDSVIEQKKFSEQGGVPIPAPPAIVGVNRQNFIYQYSPNQIDIRKNQQRYNSMRPYNQKNYDNSNCAFSSYFKHDNSSPIATQLGNRSEKSINIRARGFDLQSTITENSRAEGDQTNLISDLVSKFLIHSTSQNFHQLEKVTDIFKFPLVLNSCEENSQQNKIPSLFQSPTLPDLIASSIHNESATNQNLKQDTDSQTQSEEKNNDAIMMMMIQKQKDQSIEKRKPKTAMNLKTIKLISLVQNSGNECCVSVSDLLNLQQQTSPQKKIIISINHQQRKILNQNFNNSNEQQFDDSNLKINNFENACATEGSQDLNQEEQKENFSPEKEKYKEKNTYALLQSSGAFRSAYFKRLKTGVDDSTQRSETNNNQENINNENAFCGTENMLDHNELQKFSLFKQIKVLRDLKSQENLELKKSRLYDFIEQNQTFQSRMNSNESNLNILQELNNSLAPKKAEGSHQNLNNFPGKPIIQLVGHYNHSYNNLTGARALITKLNEENFKIPRQETVQSIEEQMNQLKYMPKSQSLQELIKRTSASPKGGFIQNFTLTSEKSELENLEIDKPKSIQDNKKYQETGSTHQNSDDLQTTGADDGDGSQQGSSKNMNLGSQEDRLQNDRSRHSQKVQNKNIYNSYFSANQMDTATNKKKAIENSQLTDSQNSLPSISSQILVQINNMIRKQDNV